jgi:hypothetical protein
MSQAPENKAFYSLPSVEDCDFLPFGVSRTAIFKPEGCRHE